jgi:hypothetical protein
VPRGADDIVDDDGVAPLLGEFYSEYARQIIGGGAGTIKRTGLVGQVWARDAVDSTAAAAAIEAITTPAALIFIAINLTFSREGKWMLTAGCKLTIGLPQACCVIGP